MKRNRLATISLTVVAMGAAACVPDPLEGFDDMGLTPNSNMNGDMGPVGDMPPGNNGGGFNTEFVAVHAVITQNCLLAGCHGMGSGAVFTVITGQQATPGELQSALETIIPAPGTGNRLIVARSPAMSEIYLRITKPAGDLGLMGQQTYGAMAVPLSPEQISTIETWITNGAIYTQ